VIHVPVDRYEGVPDYESFWDGPVAEVSDMDRVVAARREYAEGKRAERRYLLEQLVSLLLFDLASPTRRRGRGRGPG
jgi:hypothetical protein